MTQAKLAEAVGTTGAVISLLESGDRGLSDKWLRKLAPVLGTRPGHLLEVDPAETSNDILDIWADIPEERREQARDVLMAFRLKQQAAEDTSSVVRLSRTSPATQAPLRKRNTKAD